MYIRKRAPNENLDQHAPAHVTNIWSEFVWRSYCPGISAERPANFDQNDLLSRAARSWVIAGRLGPIVHLLSSKLKYL